MTTQQVITFLPYNPNSRSGHEHIEDGFYQVTETTILSYSTADMLFACLHETIFFLRSYIFVYMLYTSYQEVLLRMERKSNSERENLALYFVRDASLVTHFKR